MCKQTAIVHIEGQNILVAYKKSSRGVTLFETCIAKSGDIFWLNLEQQKQAKQQINEG